MSSHSFWSTCSWLLPLVRIGIIGCITLSLPGSPALADSTHERKSNHQSSIKWNKWGQEAFHKAQTEDKLILLDLTAVWCHACHVMDQTTYANPEVIQLLTTSFVPIRVDTDERPDLETRYRSGGWPTTNLLLPTGEIIFQANSLEPKVMGELLQEVKKLYESEKEDFQKQAEQLWEQVKNNEQITQTDGILHRPMAAHSVRMMKQQFDAVNSGFRSHPKFFEPDAIHMALTYGFFENDPELLQMGLQTLDQQVALLDPVWGGFYRYAEQADWSHPHYEKMLTIQAQNLHNYVQAFQLTGNSEYKHIALRIVDYVDRYLTEYQSAKFFESQDADVRGEMGETLVSGSQYFSWDSVHRKARGMPRIDQRTFTDSNARMAWAYLQASSVLGNPMLKEIALKNIDQFFLERFDRNKGLAHTNIEGASTLYGMLSDHVLVGHALLQAFQSTGHHGYLEKAKLLAQVTQTLLQDSAKGGFFDHPHRPSHLGLLKLPNKPATENIRVAQFYLRLFRLTDHSEYRAIAEQTLRSVVETPQPLPVALVGLAVDEWFRPPVHIAVVGSQEEPETQALWVGSEQLFCPGKIVRGFDPEKDTLRWGEIVFPYDGRPVAFLCTEQMCVPPISQPQEMRERLGELLVALKQ